MALCRAVQCYYHHRFTWQNLHHIWVIFSNSTKGMVKIKIYITFTPHHGEESDLQPTVVKSQIYTTPWWSQIYTTPWWRVILTPCSAEKSDFPPRHGEKSDLHHAMVKSQIYTSFFTMPWWKFRFTWHLHYAVVKIEIYTTFTPYRGENSDLHNIFTTSWWKFRFTQHLDHAVVKI